MQGSVVLPAQVAAKPVQDDRRVEGKFWMSLTCLDKVWQSEPSFKNWIKTCPINECLHYPFSYRQRRFISSELFRYVFHRKQNHSFMKRFFTYCRAMTHRLG